MTAKPLATELQARREALRHMHYGLYVITTVRGNTAHAITFNWLTQISFEPLLVLAAIENTSHTRAMIAETGVFAINLLEASQLDLARRMAVPFKMNPHKLAGFAHQPGITGVPLLTEALGYLECQVRQQLEVGGDHALFIAEVVAGEVRRSGRPLTLNESRLRYK